MAVLVVGALGAGAALLDPPQRTRSATALLTLPAAETAAAGSPGDPSLPSATSVFGDEPRAPPEEPPVTF